MKNPFSHLRGRHLFLAIALSTGTLGCSTLPQNPFMEDRFDRPKTAALNDEGLQLRLSYLGRFLMDGSDRERLTAQIRQQSYARRWDAVDYSIAGGALGDALAGQAGSALGSSVGVAALAGGIVLGSIFDGQMDVISQAWLPASFRGRTLSTPADAVAALDEAVAARIAGIASAIGWSLECIDGCNDARRTYAMQRPQDAQNPGYTYWPETIVIITRRSQMERVNPADPVGAALGVDVAWQTPSGDTSNVFFFAEPVLDENGNYTFLADDKTGKKGVIAVRRNLAETRIGRDLLRMYHADGLTVAGTSKEYPKKLYFKGQIYSYSISTPKMVDKVVSEEPLLPRRRLTYAH